MKYKDLIARFEPYAEEEVSMFLGYDCTEQCNCADFYTVPDGDNCIISLTAEEKDPYKAREVPIR